MRAAPCRTLIRTAGHATTNHSNCPRFFLYPTQVWANKGSLISPNPAEPSPRTAPLLLNRTETYPQPDRHLTQPPVISTPKWLGVLPDRPSSRPPTGEGSVLSIPALSPNRTGVSPPTGASLSQPAFGFLPDPTRSHPRMRASSHQTQLRPPGFPTTNRAWFDPIRRRFLPELSTDPAPTTFQSQPSTGESRARPPREICPDPTPSQPRMKASPPQNWRISDREPRLFSLQLLGAQI